ncbi:aminoglycoside phosphotransferase family protein [Yoonia sp. SDW83-1]|uniref:aminoglycoside phosphotransferase family protein n=1 Tax=Yoonia sp. SDW83-1 TaxID=3366945 RepID=UPI00398C3BE1
MKFVIETRKNAAQIVAARWNLTLQHRVADTKRAIVYKATGSEGPVALKLYKQLGASGEGAANTFLRSLEPNVGVRIHRVSTFRTAVLMEWLEGPSLDEIVADGADKQATAYLAEVAGAVRRTNFKWPIIYTRVVYKLERDLKSLFKRYPDPEKDGDLQRVLALQRRLISSTKTECVIHGDLLYQNVILSPNGPRLIDPKGLRGDPTFEFSRSLAPSVENVAVQDFIACIEHRASVMAASIDASPERVIQWGAVMFSLALFRRERNAERIQHMRPYIRAILDLSDK